jgi:tetratricopeptide (TPR) repeat protein
MRLCRRLLLVILLCAPLRAAAQPAGPAAAKAHSDAAKRHFDAKAYDQAAAELKAALRLDAKPGFMYALGQAQRLGGDCKAAIESYQRFLTTKPPVRQEEAARENIVRCEAELEARPPAPLVPPTATAPAPPPASAPAEQPRPRRAPWYQDVLGDALTGGGLALAITGFAVWGVGRDSATKANSASTYGAWASSSDGAMTMQRAGVALLSVGGALVVAGVVRYVLRPARRLERAAVALGPTPGGGAVLFAGRF